MRRVLTVFLALALPLAACGDDDDDSAADEFAGASSSSTTGQAVTNPASEGEAGYQPASNVDEHSAIGVDIEAIRTAMEPATRGEAVDWVKVGETFEKGGASKKGDGSIRTLAGLVESPAVASIRGAIAGTGESAGASDAIRRQQVDKGITVLMADKVIQELGAARGKIEAGNLEPAATGAVHNVDEAWAFFSAKGQGPAATADKRAADFGKEGKVKEAVLSALTAAQTAAVDGDMPAFDAATKATTEALNYIFYLATYKYLDHKDEVGRAEGLSFYQGISAKVSAADAKAHQAILAAFKADNAAAGRTALHTPAVLTALGVDDTEKITG